MNFSLRRVFAILTKEFLQLARDKLTLAMIIGVPLLQLCIFGFAINLNPKELPTVIAVDDPGPLARSIVAALNNSSYFQIVAQTNSPDTARSMLQEGQAIFVVEIPVNFSRDIIRGATPDLLIEVPRTACRSLEFHRAAEVIDIGHELTAQAIKTLES